MQRGIKRSIGALYSWSADKLYEPVVVHGGFRVLGGRLNECVFDQGRRAVEAAGQRPVLDIPAGTGYFTTPIAERHTGLVVAADYAWGMVRQTRAARRRLSLGNLVPMQADIHDLPFRDDSFGAVLCTNGLQVIPAPERSLAELARVLAPGGVLLAAVLTAPIGAALPARAARKLPVILRSGQCVAQAIASTGLFVTALRRQRFAHLIEAVKVR